MKDRINYYIFLPLTLLLFFLEVTFIAQIFWDSSAPNLVLVMLIATVFLSESLDFLMAAFAFGFIYDLLAGSYFGLFTLSFVLAAIAAYVLKEKFLKEESLARIASLSAAVFLVYDAIYLLLLSVIFGANIYDYYGQIWKEAAFDAVWAALAVYPAMRIISKGKE